MLLFNNELMKELDNRKFLNVLIENMEKDKNKKFYAIKYNEIYDNSNYENCLYVMLYDSETDAKEFIEFKRAIGNIFGKEEIKGENQNDEIEYNYCKNKGAILCTYSIATF